MDILICTDGSNSSIQAADLVSKFGFQKASKILILGVSEGKDDEERLSKSMELINKNIGEDFSVEKKMRHGLAAEEIVAEALEHSYDMVVVGGGGDQLGVLHPQVGSTTGKLARKLHTHFLVVRNIPDRFERILFCTGADAPASETMSLGGSWISQTSAKIGLLHVVATKSENLSTPLKEKPPTDELLERSSQQLRDAGVKNEIVTHVRQGLVVDEVLKEISEGEYELLVVGSHYQPGTDLWKGTLFDDITDQLLKRSTCSVLII